MHVLLLSLCIEVTSSDKNHCNCLVKAHFISKFTIGIYMATVPYSKIEISLEFAVLKVIYFETVTQISISINPDVFADNMKRNSDLQSMCSSFVMQIRKGQTRVKGAVSISQTKVQ